MRGRSHVRLFKLSFFDSVIGALLFFPPGWALGVTDASAGDITTIYENPYDAKGGDCIFDAPCAVAAGKGDEVFAAQEFALAKAATITAASFVVDNIFVTDPGPYVVKWMVYGVGPDGLPGAELASGSSLNGVFTQFVSTDFPYGGGRVWNRENFNLTSDVTLAAGDYYFAFQANSYNSDNYLASARFPGTAESFDGGRTWISDYENFSSFGDGVAVGLYDGVFSGVRNPAVVPESPAGRLVLMGFAALALAGLHGARGAGRSFASDEAPVASPASATRNPA